MKEYELTFTGEDFPSLGMFTFQPSLDMAYQFASKLLQSRSNKMFHTVQITNDSGSELRVCELVETRGTAEKVLA